SYFKIAITPEKIIKLIDRLETFDHSQLLAFLYDPIEKLKEDERCRLAFYLSFCVAFIHLTPEQDPQDLSPEMTQVVRDINRRLRKIKSETPNNFVQITPPLQFLFKKPDIAALPNFIPHAANSCYMAATLVPLAYVYDPLVQASLKRFEHMEKTDSREQFCSLYSQLKSEATVEITIDQVHKLRVALQREFEYRFFTPNQSTQEDAGDFLMCILQDLLQEPPTGKFLQKRTFQSVDPDQEKEPDLYDYETALSTKYTKLDEVMKDITICEGLSFNELVTEVCPTNDIDLNAYRKHQNGEGPKFQSIMAHHQEQLLVESAESAPEFFCARLRRFSQDPITGVRKKDNTPIQPSRKLEFHIKDSDNTVAYDLCAVTVHSGKTLDGGHYYCYLLHDGKIYKYDDLTGADRVVNEASVWQDVVSNGYIFHYKKRT
ncbi:MAG: ubiquitin carboxyl-terminal hydrolase, partial [Verrucomicrobia bacterium]|nr:ubiquitin carboxyl-terminal hydrolase [Verrucomicrobiota bacterium]